MSDRRHCSYGNCSKSVDYKERHTYRSLKHAGPAQHFCSTRCLIFASAENIQLEDIPALEAFLKTRHAHLVELFARVKGEQGPEREHVPNWMDT